MIGNAKVVDPTKKPDDGSVKPQIFYQILNSKNKDFGNILRTSNSASSVISYEEIGGNKEATSHPPVNVDYIIESAYAKSRAARVAEKYISLRLRRFIRHWRSETDSYLADMRFKLRSARL